MRRLIIFLGLVVFFCMSAYSQVIINGVDINKEDIKYCRLVGIGKFLSAKMNIEVDYGQPRKLLGKKDFYIKDKDGKKVVFYSMIQALNFMDKNGWEFITAYVITMSSGLKGKQNVYHYLLRKKK